MPDDVAFRDMQDQVADLRAENARLRAALTEWAGEKHDETRWMTDGRCGPECTYCAALEGANDA